MEEKLNGEIMFVEKGNYHVSSCQEYDNQVCGKNFTRRIKFLSENEDQDKMISEWNEVYKVEDLDNLHMCICGKTIKYSYIVENGLNGKRACIGSSCILKFRSKELNKKVRNLNKEYCKLCDKYINNLKVHEKSRKHNEIEMTKECIEKECKNRILKEEEFKTRCLKCHIKEEKNKYNKYSKKEYMSIIKNSMKEKELEELEELTYKIMLQNTS